MPGRILVAYASKTNATADHAGAIAGALKAAGRDADLVNLRETGKPDLGSYESVIIGSGVRIGRWYGPARRLLKRKELAGKKVALFVACGMLADDASKCDEAIQTYVNRMADKYGLRIVSGRAFVGFMPDGTNLTGAGSAKPVDTAQSVEWAAELAKVL